MKTLFLEKNDYDFLTKYMTLAAKCVELPEINQDSTKVTFKVKDYSDFQDMMNFDIVDIGMDNQDTVNKLGIQMYRIYDIILAQK